MTALDLAAALAAIGSGIVGGIFFAFSTFVMNALGRVPAGEGIRVMRAINVAVINPKFMAAFLGTALVCLGVAGASVLHWDGLRLAASLLYVLGCFGSTMVFNVPLNNQLDTDSTIWPRYLTVWTRWNHVRTAASIAASALFLASLYRSSCR